MDTALLGERNEMELISHESLCKEFYNYCSLRPSFAICNKLGMKDELQLSRFEK